MKKFLCVSLALLLSLGLFAGCTGHRAEDSEQEDPTKTTLRVATYEGGVGAEWLENAAARFEERYADAKFEPDDPNKTGVNVIVTESKRYNGETMLDSLKSETADVFFTETVNYYDHVNRGNFADITDIVKDETLEEFGEESTILSKMDTAFADYLSVDSKFYGVPFYEGIYGIMYNKQVFLEYGLYYVHSGTLEGDKADTLTFITPKNTLGETLSAGPNGELGDYDDGLPATYAQFEELVRHIREDTSVIPFSYGGSVREYPSRAMMTFWADAEGYEQMRLNFTLTGKATDLVESIGGDGTVQTYSDDVSPADAYKLRKQAGQYYALSFLNDIVLGNPGNYRTNGNTHLDAQSNFIRGILDPNAFDVYAMHFDGSWWENEASDAFATLEQLYGDAASRSKMQFGFMPIPKPTADKVGKGVTLLSQANSLAFIRSTTDKLDLAKLFLQFMHTDAELSAFTATTSMTRPFTYEIGKEDRAKMSEYAESLYAIRSDAKVVQPYSKTELFMNNQSFFAVDAWSWETNVDGRRANNPFIAFLDGSITSAADYFNGLYTYYSTNWIVR